LLEHFSAILNRLMEPNQFTRLGAKRSAIWLIGQALQRHRWTDLDHRRPVFRASWTSLASTCGQPDQGVKPA